jgi:hypothetical protein
MVVSLLRRGVFRQCALALLLSSGAAVPCLAEEAIFVAPDGRDTWSGGAATANAAGTDGPLATMSAAVRTARTRASVRQIFMRQGTYYMEAPLRLGSEDAGLRISGYRGEVAKVFGGRPITAWQHSAEGWISAMPGVAPTLTGLPILLLAGRHVPLARMPAVGTGEDHESAWFFADQAPAGIDAHRAFRVRANDLAALRAAEPGAWVSIFGQRGWLNYVLPVRQVDLSARVITLAGYAWDALGEGSRFALLNAGTAAHAADTSFWYDAVHAMLHVNDPTAAGQQPEMVVATLPCMMSIENAHDITLTGLEFAGSATDGAAICLAHTRAITIKDTTIHDTGDGIRLDAAVDTQILHNVIMRTAGSGILLRHAADGTIVQANWLHDIGWLHEDAMAIDFNASSRAQFVENRIEDVAKFAIGGGSLSDGGAYDNRFEGNEIHRTNQRTSDGGAIMVIGWAQDATRDLIRGNFISGTGALGNIGWDGKPRTQFQDPATHLVSHAIYLDDWTSGAQVSGNLICGNVGGIDLHAGWDNRVADNVLIDNAGVAITIDGVVWLGAGAHPHPMVHNLVEHNLVVLHTAAVWQSGIVTVRGGPDVAQFDHNVYTGPGLNDQAFHHDTDHIWSSYSFGIDTWRARGQDVDSDLGPTVASVTLQNDHLVVSSSHNAPAPLPLSRIGRPEDRAGLNARIRQSCGLH